MLRSSRAFAPFLVCLPVLLCPAAFADAGSSTGMLSGTVADSTGARIPGALLHIVGSAANRDATADATGRFSLRLPPGTYDITVTAPGFLKLERDAVRLGADAHANLPLTLALNTELTEVNVNSGDTDSTESANNQTAVTLSGRALRTLSDDDATFQQQIQAMAGGGDSGSTTLMVDGFSGGRFPPKAAIREIRINSNPFSAEYDSVGFGRIEIFTKPGADKMHGEFDAGGNNQGFNARNPFILGTEPPYHDLYFFGNLNGPLDKKTSFFLVGSRIDQQNNAVVNATSTTGAISQAVPNPQINDTLSARLDRQVTPNNVLTGRYEWNNTSQSNSGVGLLVLPSEGVTTSTTTQTLQLRDSETLGATTVIDTRFEYIRTRLRQTPNSTAPSVFVEGSFSGGGSPSQAIADNQDHYELQEYISRVFGPHMLRAGARFRINRESNTTTAGYNGAFTFPYLTYDPVNDGPIDNSYATGLPSQFNVTTGKASAEVSTADLGLYAEDEWKVRKDVTLDLGLRLESQTAIPDHFDPGPRLGIAYSLPTYGKKDPLAVLRGGFGIFYERFAVSNLLTAVRENGTSQLTYFSSDPGFYCATTACISSHLGSLPSIEPTIYRVSPDLHTQYAMMASFSIEHSFGDKGKISGTYIGQRGVHEYLSRNINAPLPGTYNSSDPTTGTRPFGGTQNIYQFSSDGIRHKETFFASADLNLTKKLSVWSFYILQNRTADTAGATSFPSNEYNLAQDFGRSAITKNRLFSGLWYNGPKGFNGGMFLRSFSGTPYNITTGTDLNGDTQFNDRPSFATDLTRASVVRTPLGNFDTQPIAGQSIVPINYGTSPAYASLQAMFSKEFHFGPRAALSAPPPGQPAPTGKPEPRYNLRFSVEAQNLTNHPNPGVPVGVLPSPGEPLCSSLASTTACSHFGQSISLADNFSGITGANRTLTLHTDFSF